MEVIRHNEVFENLLLLVDVIALFLQVKVSRSSVLSGNTCVNSLLSVGLLVYGKTRLHYLKYKKKTTTLFLYNERQNQIVCVLCVTGKVHNPSV